MKVIDVYERPTESRCGGLQCREVFVGKPIVSGGRCTQFRAPAVEAHETVVRRTEYHNIRNLLLECSCQTDGSRDVGVRGDALLALNLQMGAIPQLGLIVQ